MKWKRAFWIGLSLAMGVCGFYFGFFFGEGSMAAKVHNERMRPLYLAILDRAEKEEPEAAALLKSVGELLVDSVMEEPAEFSAALEGFANREEGSKTDSGL